MGIEDLLPDDEDNELECPHCGEEGEETDLYFNRCTNDDCKVMTWIPARYECGIQP